MYSCCVHVQWSVAHIQSIYTRFAENKLLETDSVMCGQIQTDESTHSARCQLMLTCSRNAK